MGHPSLIPSLDIDVGDVSRRFWVPGDGEELLGVFARLRSRVKRCGPLILPGPAELDGDPGGEAQ